MTRLLISVRNANEARIALAAGADLIDLKEPDGGALGAVDPVLAREIVAAIGRRRTTSATVGDLPADAPVLGDAARRTASSGVDLVKIGFFSSSADDVCGVIRALAPVAREVGLIAVLFVDAFPADDPVVAAAAAGFAGVMLDTADKRGGRLTDYLKMSELRDFVASANKNSLICGLAGSLRGSDIAQLAGLAPDYLGFRGAGCVRHFRGGQLDGGRVALLRKTLDDSAVGAARGGDLVTTG